MSKILYGKNIADSIMQEVALEIIELKKRGTVPLLMTLEVGEDPASKVYMTSQCRNAAKVGIELETIELAEGVSQKRLLEVLDNINRDPYISGVILQMPLPSNLNAKMAQWNIDRLKDVEGVTPYNLGRLFLGMPGLMPCTAQAIVAMIKSTGADLRGKEVAVIGNSDIVGKPAAIMMLKEEATVTVCHIATDQKGHLEEHVRRAEILIVATGNPDLIKGRWIKEGAIVIDAGINSVDNGIVGDVEFEEASERASFITPVPGGVGAVTVAYLMKNVVEAVKMQQIESGLMKKAEQSERRSHTHEDHKWKCNG
ncbi:MAG: bifunctional 5,10-methylenetetrahydrofolate dehydrogenase/5,10-methenyltetrahydrofolate cyclohydrolase [Syntrophomonadaceae bacterium]|nr:bifunctional 5,10-methylenetetrahydrofolate dehydrogenase/5,10-methenyltetrahydrofolate cyclohydrolase [Syntrophomonadaceae bacterium]